MSTMAMLIAEIESKLPDDFQWLVRSVDHKTGLYFANILHNDTPVQHRNLSWKRIHVFQAHGATPYMALHASWTQFKAVWSVDL